MRCCLYRHSTCGQLHCRPEYKSNGLFNIGVNANASDKKMRNNQISMQIVHSPNLPSFLFDIFWNCVYAMLYTKKKTQTFKYAATTFLSLSFFLCEEIIYIRAVKAITIRFTSKKQWQTSTYASEFCYILNQSIVLHNI